MSRIRKIISIYLSYRQPRSTRKEFAEWFAAPFDGETKQRLMREYWDALSPEMSQDRVQKAYARVRERIGFRSVSLPSPQGVRPVFRRAAVMVAMIAIPVLAVALYALIGHMNSAPKWQEIYAPYGQTRSVVLADGSQIVINSGSRLIYPDRFAGKERRVFLSGEAYADIAKNPKRSFVLSADDVDILVHGTSFRVSSYVNDSEVEVALLSGAIDMQTKNLQQNCKIQMTPGDMVKVDKRSGRVTSMRFPGGTFANGIDDGHLTFINSRLSDIARQLERTFDVKIVIDSQQLADERYYSVFINHETLDEILSILEQNGDMKHRREGEMIHLYKK